MKTFRIFEHPQRGKEAVKVGFSWPAFFFGTLLSFFGCFLWLLYKGLWRQAGLWFVILLFVVFVENAIRSAEYVESMKEVMQYALFSCYFAIMLIPAFQGNAWRARKLTDKGYVLRDTVDASSPAQALKSGQTG